MKKTAFILAVLILTVGLCSCQAQKPDTDETTESHETNETSVTSSNMSWQTVLYKMSDGPAAFKSECTSDFDSVEFIDEAAPQSISMDILNTSYTLIYKNSAILPTSDLKVNVYNLQDTDYSKVFINAETGSAVKYISIPYSAALTSETDYIDFIKNIIGSKYDLSGYDFKCTTHYYIVSDSGVRSTVEDGFRTCSDGEVLGTYSFYYTKSISDIKAEEHISAEFHSDNTFTLEMYDLNYSADIFSPLLKMSADLEEDIKDFLQSDLKDGYKINDITVKSKRFFVKGGVPYIRSTATVLISQGADTEEYTLEVQTVSKLT